MYASSSAGRTWRTVHRSEACSSSLTGSFAGDRWRETALPKDSRIRTVEPCGDALSFGRTTVAASAGNWFRRRQRAPPAARNEDRADILSVDAELATGALGARLRALGAGSAGAAHRLHGGRAAGQQLIEPRGCLLAERRLARQRGSNVSGIESDQPRDVAVHPDGVAVHDRVRRRPAGKSWKSRRQCRRCCRR